MGVSPPEMLRENEILETRGVRRLEESREFASVGRELLLRARELETGTTAAERGSTDKTGEIASVRRAKKRRVI